MLDFLSSVFDTKDFSVEDKTFVKSFILAFPLSYASLADTKFVESDIFNRVMITASDVILSFTISIIFLFMLSRVERQKSRNNMYFFLAPIFLQVSGIDNIQSFAFAFCPFIIYAVIIRFARYIDNIRN